MTMILYRIYRFLRAKYVTVIVCFALMLFAYEFIDDVFFQRIYYRIDNRLKRYHFVEEPVVFNDSDIRLTANAINFVNIVNKAEADVFLVDPSVLIRLIDNKSRRILINRDSLLNPMPVVTDYCISFGVFMNDKFDDLARLLNEEMTKQSFSISCIEGLDGSQRNYKKDSSQIANTFLHIFYIKNNDCIQISVFHKRHDFLWIGSIPALQEKSHHKLMPKDIHYGRHESAFDDFGLQSVNLLRNNITVLIPDKVIHFISQYKTSEFIECNHSLAKNFTQTHGKELTESERQNRRVKHAIQSLKAFTSRLFIPFFISSGTLLGWYRQCGVIPYTYDVDTATWATYASDQLIDAFMHNDVNIKLSFIYGFIDNGFQFALYSEHDLRLDMFFTYKEGSNLTFTGHLINEKAYFRYIFSNFTLCSAELLGLKVHVPCIPHQVIAAEYGSNWTTPVQHWPYSSGPDNRGPIKYWTNEQFKHAYRVYAPFT